MPCASRPDNYRQNRTHLKNGTMMQDEETIISEEVTSEETGEEIAPETSAADVDASADDAAPADGETVDAGEDQDADPKATIEALQAELDAARAETEAQRDQAQRLAAEFQNSKRRQEKQLADAIDRAGTSIIQQLLPLLDDYDLAFGNVPDDLDPESTAWVDGFRQIQRKLLTLLEDQGVTPIASDGVFDPNLHEAVTSEPTDEVESGHIIDTLRTGYEYKGRVLRPALVRVAA